MTRGNNERKERCRAGLRGGGGGQSDNSSLPRLLRRSGPSARVETTGPPGWVSRRASKRILRLFVYCLLPREETTTSSEGRKREKGKTVFKGFSLFPHATAVSETASPCPQRAGHCVSRERGFKAVRAVGQLLTALQPSTHTQRRKVKTVVKTIISVVTKPVTYGGSMSDVALR